MNTTVHPAEAINPQAAVSELKSAGASLRILPHSEGPWRLAAGSSSWDIYSSGYFVCEVPNVSKRAENAANARLIAAAPELLASCVAYLADRKEAGCTADSAAVKSMRAAIAKATGAQQ